LLAKLPSLQVLNVAGLRVTDAGVACLLGGAPALQEVICVSTEITLSALVRMRKRGINSML
jgi:hypothetical protein